MFASRIMAYEKDYNVKIKCPNCSHQNKVTIDLSELGAKEIDFDKLPKGVNEFETMLPAAKKKITFKLLNSADEQAITDEMKRIKKKIVGMGDTEVTTRLKYAIVSIEGKDNRGEIRVFVDSMLSKDSLFLRNQIVQVSPDIDSTFDFTCTECGHNEELNVPMDISFFWPSSKL